MSGKNQVNINASDLLVLMLLKGDQDSFIKLLNILGNSGPSLTDQHMGITCDGCGAKNFIGCRFKCYQCQNYNHCLRCFKKWIVTKTHKQNHSMIAFRIPISPEDENQIKTLLNQKDKLQEILKKSGVEHVGSECDVCQQKPIMGIKFKCDQCPQYQLCCDCFTKGKTSQNHSTVHRSVALISQVKDFKSDQIEVLEKSNKSGCFGSVVRAKLKSNGKIVALKTIQAQKQDNNNFSVYTAMGSLKKQTWINQRKCYSEFFSQHIINCYGFWSQKYQTQTRLYMILQWMESTLQNEVKKGTSSKRRLFQHMLDVVMGLFEMHEKKFIHKDIKPDNILISKNGEAKLGDLGISQLIGQQSSNISSLCHADFGAPEALKHEFTNQKMDMFAYGLTLNYVFTGNYHKRNGLQVNLPGWSPHFKQVVVGCLEFNVEKRMSSKRVLHILNSFDQIFWYAIDNQMGRQKYMVLPKKEKDAVFDSIYEKLWPAVYQKCRKKD